MEAMLITLKVCPFCGGSASVVEKDACGNYRKSNLKQYIVRCDNAECIGRLSKRYKECGAAIAAWNTRAGAER